MAIFHSYVSLPEGTKRQPNDSGFGSPYPWHRCAGSAMPRAPQVEANNAIAVQSSVLNHALSGKQPRNYGKIHHFIAG